MQPREQASLKELFESESNVSNNKLYRKLFAEAGLPDTESWSFRKGEKNTLEISALESKPKSEHDLPVAFEKWLKKVLKLDPATQSLPVTKTTEPVALSFNKITFHLSSNELDKIDKIIMKKRIHKQKRTDNDGETQRAVETKDQHQKAEIKDATSPHWAASQYRDSDGSSTLTFPVFATESERSKDREKERKKQQPITQTQREYAKNAYASLEQKALETAQLQEQQHQDEQNKLREKAKKEKEEKEAVKVFFENTETITDLQDMFQVNYGWKPETNQIKLAMSEDGLKVICNISSAEGTPKIIQDLDEWMDHEDSKNQVIVEDLKIHFTRYKTYLSTPRRWFSPANYALKDSAEKLAIVENLLISLEETDEKSYTQLIVDFRDKFSTTDAANELSQDRYKSEAIRLTASVFKRFKWFLPASLSSFLFSENDDVEGKKVVSDEKVTRVINPRR